ncbi:MAG: iron-containing alcohol dehydrogenase [Thermotogae bacterium]|nr:iron-containing alcohol dehydrogenase [Thermotogota bacterium]
MYKINFFLPTRLIFGVDTLEKLPKEAKKLGKKAMIVTGRNSTKKSGLLNRVKKLLEKANIESIVYDKVVPNPLSTHVDEAGEIAKNEKIDFVIGLGGGSAIDSAKCVAIVAANRGKIWNYVDVVGGKKPKKALPIVAITTTHGTGTEADPFAVVTNPDTKEKVGIGYDVTIPTLSIVDPRLMITLPKNQTAYTSLDAFYHSIEAFLNINANPFSDTLALESMKRIITNLPRAYENGKDLDARTNLAWANTAAGLTETITGVIANHSIEHGISGFYPEVPHGLGLCITGPYLFEKLFNKIYNRLAIVGREVFGIYESDEKRAGMLAIEKIRDFQESFGLNKKLRDFNIKKSEFDDIAKVAFKIMYGPIKVTPGKLTEKDIVEILEKAY